MMLFRLLQWALRLPCLPQGHEPGCRAGIDGAPLNCKCNYSTLRPPTLGEAITGLSGT
jgi:hypothetical protein